MTWPEVARPGSGRRTTVDWDARDAQLQAAGVPLRSGPQTASVAHVADVARPSGDGEAAHVLDRVEAFLSRFVAYPSEASTQASGRPHDRPPREAVHPMTATCVPVNVTARPRKGRRSGAMTESALPITQAQRPVQRARRSLPSLPALPPDTGDAMTAKTHLRLAPCSPAATPATTPSRPPCWPREPACSGCRHPSRLNRPRPPRSAPSTYAASPPQLWPMTTFPCSRATGGRSIGTATGWRVRNC